MKVTTVDDQTLKPWHGTFLHSPLYISYSCHFEDFESTKTTFIAIKVEIATINYFEYSKVGKVRKHSTIRCRITWHIPQGYLC